MAVQDKKIQSAKIAAVEDVTKLFEKSSDFIFTEYRGLTVQQITSLRKKLRETGSSYKVVKNTYAQIAFNNLRVESVDEFLKGPTAITLVGEEASPVSKILFDFAKEAPALVIKGGVIGGEVYDAAKIEAFSKLPGKKELISMLMSVMLENTSKLARALKAVADQKEEA